MNRLDWWNIKAEHTAYEWACQIAMSIACPFGERRKDIREAYHTAHLLASQSPQQLTNDEFSTLWDTLSKYLKCHEDAPDPNQTANLDALALMKRGTK